MFCKGADSVIMERLAKSERNSQLLPATTAHLEQFSQSGLRTLLVAEKDLTPEEWEAFRKEWITAANQIEGRDEAVSVTFTPRYIYHHLTNDHFLVGNAC